MAAPKPHQQTTSRIVCVLVPRFNMMSLVSALEPVRIANYLSAAPLYRYQYCAVDGAEIKASNGMSVSCDSLPEKLSKSDLVLVFGSWGAEHYANPALLSWLRRQERLGIRICAVEMAPYIFARAGLLAGRLATTHWSYLDGFKELFPRVQGVEQVFTVDGRIMTCAGSTGSLDFMLHIVREDHGEALIGEIADNILHAPPRAETDGQRSKGGHGLDGLPPAVNATVELMNVQISEPPSVPEIARMVGLSQRQLERQFKRVMGCSVVQFGLVLRLQHARVLLISTELSVREIAAASGFNSLSHFAYAFRNCFERRPSEYRQAWPEGRDTPSWPGALAAYLEKLRSGQKTGASQGQKAN